MKRLTESEIPPLVFTFAVGAAIVSSACPEDLILEETAAGIYAKRVWLVEDSCEGLLPFDNPCRTA